MPHSKQSAPNNRKTHPTKEEQSRLWKEAFNSPFSDSPFHFQEKNKDCDHPACSKEGSYPAPKNRSDLRNYLWFCLEHIRDYNANWDYCKGLSYSEVEALHEPSFWSEAETLRSKSFNLEDIELDDPFGFFQKEPSTSHTHKDRHIPPSLKEALSILELNPPLTLDSLKKRYKNLVKKWHPDQYAHQGTAKESEEKLKKINRAYYQLKTEIDLLK